MAKPKLVTMPSASFIVARSYPDFVIGCDNALPWKQRTDLRRFRELTEGNVVIMGRKTLESIGKPLPNRVNIVLSREEWDHIEGVEWVNSAEEAVFLADFFSILRNRKHFFVIGGQQIYEYFLKKELFDTVYLTEIFANIENADAYFTYEFDFRRWKLLEERDFPASNYDQYPFRFTTYRKKFSTIRIRFRSDFLTRCEKASAWKESAIEALEKWEKSTFLDAVVPNAEVQIEFPSPRSASSAERGEG